MLSLYGTRYNTNLTSPHLDHVAPFLKVSLGLGQTMAPFLNPNLNTKRKPLNGRTILFNWAVVGWCEGKLTANVDGRRKKVDGVTTNFWAYYAVDQEECIHSLTLATYLVLTGNHGRLGSFRARGIDTFR